MLPHHSVYQQYISAVILPHHRCNACGAFSSGPQKGLRNNFWPVIAENSTFLTYFIISNKTSIDTESLRPKEYLQLLSSIDLHFSAIFQIKGKLSDSELNPKLLWIPNMLRNTSAAADSFCASFWG